MDQMQIASIFSQSIVAELEKHCMQYCDVKFGVQVGKLAFANLNRLVEQNPFGYDLAIHWVMHQVFPVLAYAQALMASGKSQSETFDILRDELLLSARQPKPEDRLRRWIPFQKQLVSLYVRQYFAKNGVCAHDSNIQFQKAGDCVEIHTEGCLYAQCLQKYYALEFCAVFDRHHEAVLERKFPKVTVSVSSSPQTCRLTIQPI